MVLWFSCGTPLLVNVLCCLSRIRINRHMQTVCLPLFRAQWVTVTTLMTALNLQVALN